MDLKFGYWVSDDSWSKMGPLARLCRCTSKTMCIHLSVLWLTCYTPGDKKWYLLPAQPEKKWYLPLPQPEKNMKLTSITTWEKYETYPLHVGLNSWLYLLKFLKAKWNLPATQSMRELFKKTRTNPTVKTILNSVKETVGRNLPELQILSRPIWSLNLKYLDWGWKYELLCNV